MPRTARNVTLAGALTALAAALAGGIVYGRPAIPLPCPPCVCAAAVP